MMGVIQRLFKRTPHHAEGEQGPVPTAPAAGQIYSFRTRPYSEFARSTTDRYAALKVLGACDKFVTVAVLDGIWAVAPTVGAARATSILNEHRFAHTGKDLGPKPRKADARAILKRTVLWFNEADEEFGGVIETEEREDICAVLEEMAHAARQKALVDEIDEWRDW